MTVTELLAPFTDADTPLGELARTPGLPEAPEALLDHLASAGVPREQQSAAWQLLTLAGAAEQPEHPRAGHGRAMTEERKHVFLETLSATGSPVAAAEAATPWSTGGRGGIQSFYDERKRDPEFADAWTRAEAAALAAVETELVRRAFQPERRPIVSNGQVLGEHQTYDNRLLLRVPEPGVAREAGHRALRPSRPPLYFRDDAECLSLDRDFLIDYDPMTVEFYRGGECPLGTLAVDADGRIYIRAQSLEGAGTFVATDTGGFPNNGPFALFHAWSLSIVRAYARQDVYRHERPEGGG